MLDEKTTHREYPLPFKSNQVEDDVDRIIDSFEKIDTDVNDLNNSATSVSSDITTAKRDIQSGVGLYATSTGSGTAYEVNLNPALSSLTVGQVVHMQAHTPNTGSATLGVDGLGAKTIKKTNGSDLKAGEIISGAACILFYDGTDFQLINSKADQKQVEVLTSNLMLAYEELQENHGGSLNMETGWSDSFGNANEQGADEANSAGYIYDAANTLYKGSDPGDKNNDDNYDIEANYIQQEWTNSLLSTSQATVTNSSATVTLASGVWPTNCAYGRISFDAGLTWYGIATRTDDTNIKLVATTTESSTDYDYIIRMSEIGSGEARLNRMGSLNPNTKLLLHMGGKELQKSLKDYSPSNHTVTFNGQIQLNAYQGTGVYPKFGKTSLDVDGGYLYIADHSDWDFGTGDFTVEAWVHPGSPHVFHILHQSSGIELHRNASGFLIFGSSTSTTAWSISGGTWYHVAVTRSGTDLKFWLDGNQLGSTISNSQNFNGSGNLIIGSNNGGGNNLNGHMDDLRITKGEALYSANFTAPTTPFGPISPKEECISVASTTDSSTWLDINSASSTELKGNEEIFYWLSLDPASGYGPGTEIKIGSFNETKVAGTSDIPLNTNYSESYNIVHRTFALPNSTQITHLGLRLGWASGMLDTFTIKIMTENSLTNYTNHYVESFVPVNNSDAVTWYKLTNPYTTPGSGTVRMGFYWNGYSGAVGITAAISGYNVGDTQVSNGGGNYGLETYAPGWFSFTHIISCGYRKAGGATFSWRNIVRNNGGTWQWNTNTDYGSAETWTDATVNDMLHAISEAVEQNTANRMDKADLERISDDQWEETGGWSTSTNTLVRGVTIRTMNEGNDPSVSQFRINHLGNRDPMDLKSKTYDPGFVPNEAYLWAREEHPDADGAGTFSVSRNGGSEWETISMVQQGLPFGDVRVMRGTVDLNGQTSGQDLRCRYETASAKDQFLHSWGLQAKP
jgi:hypothetical protein